MTSPASRKERFNLCTQPLDALSLILSPSPRIYRIRSSYVMSAKLVLLRQRVLRRLPRVRIDLVKLNRKILHHFADHHDNYSFISIHNNDIDLVVITINETNNKEDRNLSNSIVNERDYSCEHVYATLDSFKWSIKEQRKCVPKRLVSISCHWVNSLVTYSSLNSRHRYQVSARSSCWFVFIIDWAK